MTSYVDCTFPLTDSFPGAEGFRFPHSDDPLEHCEEHGASLSTFCLDDLEPLCKQCAAANHADHRVYLLTDAATDCKEELKSSLKRLKKKLTSFQKVTQTYENISKHNETETKVAEEHIKNDFKQLHQFLQREEADRLLALREEKQVKVSEANETRNKVDLVIKSLEERIELIEEELDADGDGVEFLKNYQEPAERSCTDIRIDRGLINVTKHLGNLRFSMWDKMKHIAPYTPVTLDPRTAGKALQVSDGLHTVLTVPGSTKQDRQRVPVLANPERFYPYPSVLGKEGFDSGVHSWAIEVGDTKNWTTGIAAQSISRQAAFETCPEAGLWCICLRNGEYLARTTPSQSLHLDGSHPLTRIRVMLNWDEGQLDFKDADTDMCIFTFRHQFQEKVYPYFESTSDEGILSLVAQRVRITLESDYMEDAAIANEDQVAKNELCLEKNITTVPTNSEMSDPTCLTEQNPPSNCSTSKEKTTNLKKTIIKRKPAAVREKKDVIPQTSKIQLSDNYHVSLFRTLKIINNQPGKQK